MKITIDLTRKEMAHLWPNHTFYDCCGDVEGIMLKVQRQVCKFFIAKKKEQEEKKKSPFFRVKRVPHIVKVKFK